MNRGTYPEMPEELFRTPDLWENLSREKRTVVLYGMGNGAEKILSVCKSRGIPVREVFASDEFVRGQVFRGFPVRRWEEVKTRYGAENTVVLLSFATSRPDVLAHIRQIASETTLLVPDVPVFGDGLFDRSFLASHRAEILAARELLTDAESRRIFDLTLRAKLTGSFTDLLEAVSDPSGICERIHPERFHTVADLGAYTGDTIRSLAAVAPALRVAYAMEPDPRNFRKLTGYAAEETRFRVIPVPAAAWSAETELFFDGSGNRNASALSNRSAVLGERPVRSRSVPALPLDRVVGTDAVDFIKYDVEGSEWEAILGSRETILRSAPVLMVSVYHRVGDPFELPLRIREQFPFYKRFYLRRPAGVPAWDLHFYAVPDEP